MVSVVGEIYDNIEEVNEIDQCHYNDLVEVVLEDMLVYGSHEVCSKDFEVIAPCNDSD